MDQPTSKIDDSMICVQEKEVPPTLHDLFQEHVEGGQSKVPPTLHDLFQEDVEGGQSKVHKGFKLSKMNLCGGCFRRPKNKDAVLLQGCDSDQYFETLLNSPSVLLGEGYGSTFKVSLEDGTSIALKSLKGSSFSRENLETVRRIQHQNVVGLKSFFCSKKEVYLVYDYFEESFKLSYRLHGNDGQNGSDLDWGARMSIALGTAQGIIRIHRENNGSMVHGNIKSSNVFLTSQGHGCISEFGIASAMKSLTPATIAKSCSFAPELSDTRNSSQSADVYSFGVLMLELLTGQQAFYKAMEMALARWVKIASKSEWSADLLDAKLQMSTKVENKLINLLSKSMSCVDTVPSNRPSLPEMVTCIEDVLDALVTAETSTPDHV